MNVLLHNIENERGQNKANLHFLGTCDTRTCEFTRFRTRWRGRWISAIFYHLFNTPSPSSPMNGSDTKNNSLRVVKTENSVSEIKIYCRGNRSYYPDALCFLLSRTVLSIFTIFQFTRTVQFQHRKSVHNNNNG